MQGRTGKFRDIRGNFWKSSPHARLPLPLAAPTHASSFGLHLAPHQQVPGIRRLRLNSTLSIGVSLPTAAWATFSGSFSPTTTIIPLLFLTPTTATIFPLLTFAIFLLLLFLPAPPRLASPPSPFFSCPPCPPPLPFYFLFLFLFFFLHFPLSFLPFGTELSSE